MIASSNDNNDDIDDEDIKMIRKVVLVTVIVITLLSLSTPRTGSNKMLFCSQRLCRIVCIVIRRNCQ